MDTLDWLLDADPAIRWQAMRDLPDASPATIAAERARVPREGIGAQKVGSRDRNLLWTLIGVGCGRRSSNRFRRSRIVKHPNQRG